MQHHQVHELVSNAAGDADRFRELPHLLSPEIHRELSVIDQRNGRGSPEPAIEITEFTS